MTEPNPIIAQVLGRLGVGAREAFAEAFVAAIEEVATAKAEALEGRLWRADFGPIIHFDEGYPWRLSWREYTYDDNSYTTIVEVAVTLEEILQGVNIDAIRAEREAREAEKARRAADIRAQQEALRASARAKIVAAGLTLEEQVALGVSAYIVK